ncbi:MAG: acetyl-CoA acetyltransferase [Thermodesulfobacteriota bacterium]
MQKKHIPVIVGISQYTQPKDAACPLDPLGLMARTGREAFEEAGGGNLLRQCDTIRVINLVSYPYADACGELGRTLGINPGKTVYGGIGGNSPQMFVNQAAAEIAAGNSRVTLIAGAEAAASVRRFQKSNTAPDWPAGGIPQRIDTDNREGFSPLESRHNFLIPAFAYAMLENALRHALGRDLEDHRLAMGRLFERFARAASRNPRAWVREAYTADAITLTGPDNRMVCFPYTMRMIANYFVDQSAAIVMTSEETADEIGIHPSRRIYPMGGAGLCNIWNMSRRADLTDSPALREAIWLALDQAGIRTEDIDFFDLYSCFPSAVEIACRELGIPENDPRDLTVTGGLPYFGGPGNNYSLHAIAGVVERLRANPGQKALVTALGWYNTKWAVGIYGSLPGAHPWEESDYSAIQERIDAEALPEPLEAAEGNLCIETYVIGHGRAGEPDHGIVLGRLENGRRAFARIDAAPRILEEMEKTELIGLSGRVRHDGDSGYNYVTIEGF